MNLSVAIISGLSAGAFYYVAITEYLKKNNTEIFWVSAVIALIFHATLLLSLI